MPAENAYHLVLNTYHLFQLFDCTTLLDLTHCKQSPSQTVRFAMHSVV